MDVVGAGFPPWAWLIGGACVGTTVLWFVLVKTAVDMDEFFGRTPHKPANEAAPHEDAA